jgi:hypothetical protein
MVVHPASNGISRVPPYSRAPPGASSTVAYGTLTRSGRPFQQRSASRLVCIAPCWLCRTSRGVVQPHAGSGGSLAVTGMVWAAPGSLTATSGMLSFPRGTEMFQFPRLPPHTLVYSGAGLRVSPRRGCPIRTPSDHRLPAAPRGVSSPGHVLHRPQTPRHPPCARHANPPSVCACSPEPAQPSGPPCTHDTPYSVSRCVNLLRLTISSVVKVPGGAAGTRTPDLRRAKAALSRLSYSPVVSPPVGVPGLEPGTSPLSGVRSDQLS